MYTLANLNSALPSFLAEARLMDNIFIASGQNGFDKALKLLDELDLACNNSVFSHFSIQSSPLRCVRACFKLALEQYSIYRTLSLWQSESQGLDGYRSLISKMADITPKSCTWLPRRMIEGFWYAADRLELLSYQIKMREQGRSTDLTRFKRTYQELLSLVEKGSFSRLNPDDVLAVRAKGIRLMLDQARDAKQWQEGILLCDEYLAMAQNSAKGLPRALGSWIRAKDEYKRRLNSEALEEAKDNSDFDKCLKLL